MWKKFRGVAVMSCVSLTEHQARCKGWGNITISWFQNVHISVELNIKRLLR